MTAKLTIDFVEEVEVSDIAGLYRDAGWWEDGFDPGFIPAMVRGSWCFALARLDEKVIGMGRALSDGCSDAYIQDVVVLREHRGNGIGGMIIDAIVKRLRQNEIDWIGLIGEPGTGEFYEKHGFKVLKEYIPMRYCASKD